MKKIIYFVTIILLISCGGNQQTKDKSNETVSEFNETLEYIKILEKRIQDCANMNIQDLLSLRDSIQNFDYDYNPLGMTESEMKASENLKRRVTELKEKADEEVSRAISTAYYEVFHDPDILVEQIMAWPVHLERGDVLYYKIEVQNPSTVKLYNVDAKQTLRTYTNSLMVSDSLVIKNKGIYLVELNPGNLDNTQYADIDIKFRGKDLNRYSRIKEVFEEKVPSKSSAFRVSTNMGLDIKPIFDEPRKFTLSSNFKSFLSTAAKSIALVPVKVPAGATDVLYNLRISTSEQDQSSDGEFFSITTNKYESIRFKDDDKESSKNKQFGVKLDFINSLLDANRPIKEEDAYCNMYVFRDQGQAKQFQDEIKPASQLSYDTDWSMLGTQSCSGRIPVKGPCTIYLAFQNERLRYSNYIWVEVLALTPVTEYYTTHYYVKN